MVLDLPDVCRCVLVLNLCRRCLHPVLPDLVIRKPLRPQQCQFVVAKMRFAVQLSQCRGFVCTRRDADQRRG